MNNIDLNLYKIFLKVYECNSISKAANEMYITQPSVSYSIKTLENQLNTKLFYRDKNGMQPTESAKILYYYVIEGLNILKNGQLKMDSLSNLKVGTIKIGAPTNIGVAILPEIIKEFNKIYPNIKFEIVSMLLSDMIEMLEKRELDFIVDFLPVISQKYRIDVKNIKKMTISFVARKDYLNIGNKNDFFVNDLEKFNLIIPREGSEIRKQLNKFFLENNIKPSVLIEVSTQLLTKGFVEEGLGIGCFVKQSIKNDFNADDYFIFEFEGKLPFKTASIAYIPSFLSYCAEEFLNFINCEGKLL